jgi:KDO2-lipid IV(A) lauroyltransferase
MDGNEDNMPPPLGYRLSAWAVSKTPHSLLGLAANAGGFIQYWLSGEKRRDYLSNIAPVARFTRQCPPWRAFQNQALNVLELLKAASQSNEDIVTRIALHGESNIDHALSAGKGLILTTYHTGNWELAGLALALRGYPITTVAGEQLRPGWSEQVKRVKERFGVRMVRTGGEIRTLYGDLRSNRAIVLHIDGDVFTGGYDVSFLGQSVTVPRGPAHLSRVLSCPLSLAYCRRSRGNRLDVTVEPAVTPPTDAAGEIRLTQTLMTRIEKCIVEDPGQWCIFRKLSRTAGREMS